MLSLLLSLLRKTFMRAVEFASATAVNDDLDTGKQHVALL